MKASMWPQEWSFYNAGTTSGIHMRKCECALKVGSVPAKTGLNPVVGDFQNTTLLLQDVNWCEKDRQTPQAGVPNLSFSLF